MRKQVLALMQIDTILCRILIATGILNTSKFFCSYVLLSKNKNCVLSFADTGKKFSNFIAFSIKNCRYRQENAIFALFLMNKLADRRSAYGLYFGC